MNSVRRETQDTELQLEWLESLVCSDDQMMTAETHGAELAEHSESVSTWQHLVGTVRRIMEWRESRKRFHLFHSADKTSHSTS